ncbi:MAG: selenocysteine-specific translation elongation factor [Veillonellales bacterium]
MAQHIVIGTAGHVDHGKTMLIKALTGIETDTTIEEKKRGMSINLGFAYLDLPNHTRVGIVDVPGHERFIKNMVAGLPGINLVLLVIDANEGVMPQTREHLDILTLLGVRNFLIVLTKIDTVDADLKEMAIEDIRDQLADTIVADAAIVETDAVTGRGIPELIQKIQDMTEQIPDVVSDGMARLNIDRVFSVKGFGTVVTGTLLDGSVSIGDELYVYPGGKKVRIRNIQIHEQNVKKAEPKQRTALNLANIAKDELQRGDVLAASDKLKATWMLDVKVKCLGRSPLSIGLWDRVRLLVGTREVMARTVPIGTEAINPGEEGFVQLRLEQEQLVVKERDYFILRTFSPIHTIAGGEILDASPVKHRRFKADILESLKAKDDGIVDEIVADFLLHKKSPFTTKAELEEYTGFSGDDLQMAIDQLNGAEVIRETPLGYLHKETYKKLRGQVLQILLNYHRKHSLRQGMDISEFRSCLGKDLSERDISELLQLMIEGGICREKDHIIAASNFEVVFNPAQQQTKRKIEVALEKAGFTAVKTDEFTATDKNAAAVLEALNGDTVVFLTFEYVILKRFYQQAVQQVREYLRTNEKIELGDFRDMIGSSRKASLLILEYMDKMHITKRMKDYRVAGECMEVGE